MTSEIKVDTISEQTSANGVTIDGLTIKDGNIIGDVALAGTTPTFTIGDAGAEDAALIFDGNAQDFYIALDDSADDLVIGTGSTIGSNVKMVIENGGNIGIGTASPDTEFHVVGAGTVANFEASDGAAFIAIKDADGTQGFIGCDTGALVFQTSGSSFSNKMSIGTNGATTITTADNSDTLSLISTDADASSGPNLRMYRNSSSPAQNDVAGVVEFEGRNNNSQDVIYAQILSKIETTTDGSEDGDFKISTMNAGTLRERLAVNSNATVFNEDSIDVDFRVESNNNINMFKVDAGDDRTHFGSTSHNGSTLGVHNFYSGTTSDQPGIILSSNSASYADELLTVGCLRSASASYFLFEGRSGNGSDDAFNDIEFKVNGVGAVTADGAYDGSGADYAEYFEWKDGNSSSEDRRGYSVVLDGNKIVKATSSDDVAKIIGVISATPAVVGDSDIDRWKEKYLRDDFGSPIMEEFTVTSWRDEANKTDHSYATDRIPTGITAPSDATVLTTEKDKYGNDVNIKRRKLNPDWNKDTAYISREDRKEWDTVGLMGKLRLKKGQPTGTNWIKMRDISDTVEEWLVR